MKVKVDEKAKVKILQENVKSVHCFLHVCYSWAGQSVQPTVLVGSPNQLDRFDVYEDNGITVYVQKDLEIPSDTLLITTSAFLWFERLVVVGMV